MNRFSNHQRGAGLIVVIVILLIVGTVAAAFVSLINTESFTAMNQSRGLEAFYVAAGGQEYMLKNRTFPNYSTQGTATALGTGTFVVATPTYLTAAVGVGNTTINVSSTSGFAAPAVPPPQIVIDSEVMSYTAMTATTFTLSAGAAGAHASGNAVYPVTSLTADPLVGGTTINVNSTTGFLIPGAIKIGSEYLFCTATTATTFTNCTRGYRGTTAASHASGSNLFQYIITSTGTVSIPTGGAAQRVMKVGLDSGAGTGIAFDAPSSATNNTASLTWSHTVGAGSNSILVVGVSILNNSSQTVTGVTYAGVPLTLIGSQNNGTNARVELWYRLVPATGANNVVVTLSAAAAVVGGAVSFTGVDQTSPVDASAFNSGNITPVTVTITTVTNNAWVVDVLASLASSANTVTAAAGQTERWNVAIGGNPNARGAGSTKGPISPAGAVTMSWSLTGGPPRRSAIGAVALKPAIGSVSTLDWRETY
ncbi:MAG: hypothetical protein HY283_09330 [Nitrospirae bacterium]|nr:hypothetical protein [Nitrospirota bacterium]